MLDIRVAVSFIIIAVFAVNLSVNAQQEHSQQEHSQENHAHDDQTINSDKILVTVVLKHQQDKNLTELQEKMDANRFWQSFPPEGIEIDSWYVAMGLGQVIVVKILPKDLRRLNLAIEKAAWGIFDTEIYPTYEFEAIAAGIKKQKIEQENSSK